jgi:phosphatidylinositol kinase/protein kinase (PI-3  family)
MSELESKFIDVYLDNKISKQTKIEEFVSNQEWKLLICVVKTIKEQVSMIIKSSHDMLDHQR